MLPASPAIAGARREPDPLHLLLTGIGRHASHCFCLLHSSSGLCPRYSNTIGARSTMWSVRVLLQISYCKAVALCGHDKPTACRWNSMRRAATLCMLVMGVARADGLYGHGLCQCDVYATRDAPEAAGTQRRATQSAKTDLFFVSCHTYGCNKPGAPSIRL